MSEPEPLTQPRPNQGNGEPFDWFLRIPNRLELMKPIRDLIAATCHSHGVDEEIRQELLLAVSEIVNNSIEHVRGRGEGGYHEVEVTFGVGPEEIVGRIRDEGEGGISEADFDGAIVPSLDSDRGRGLLLIKAYVDELHVSNVKGGGTEILFRKRRAAAGGGSA